MYSDPEDFLVRAEHFLVADSFSPSVIATVTTRIASRALANSSDNAWLTVEEDDSRVVGLAMHTPPHNMFLSRMPEDAAFALAREVAKSGRSPSGVNGAVGSTRAFARAWEESTDHPSTVIRERGCIDLWSCAYLKLWARRIERGPRRTSAWSLTGWLPSMTKLSPTLQAMTRRLWHNVEWTQERSICGA